MVCPESSNRSRNPSTLPSKSPAPAADSCDTYDAILVDYHMPGMDGCELAAKIREIDNCKTIPIILMSSVDVTCQPLSEDQHIFEIYLLKPVRSDTLKAVLANAVKKNGGDGMLESRKATPMPKKSVTGAKANEWVPIKTKTDSAVDALKNGVHRVHFIDGEQPHSLLLEIFTDKGVGTEIVNA